jgi:serine/threonine protein kinase
MRVPSTADQFLELVSKSGLLDPQRLQAFLQRRAGAGGKPRALADELVREGLLTRFQVEQLLAGKWRNFILSGKYKVLGPLGSGGMGHVYMCEHQIMRRRVAVKVLPLRAGDQASLDRFHREARAVAQLKHNNIVGGYDIDRDGRLHFLVMEYIDGNTLQKIVKRGGPMDPVRACHYIRQAALGLQHAHEGGLVHRDIKPSNLLLDRSGTIKVLDLGLARFFNEEADDLSKRHGDAPVGTMDYMAPEQAINSHEVDIRADIYSLGATFYFLLAGQSPFQGRTPVQKLMCHQREHPRPIHELRPQVPTELGAIVERMMAKDPAERYQTPAEVAEALAPCTRTPIDLPPPEEMPKLLSPAPVTPDGPASPRLPASLYEAVSVPVPRGGREMETALPGATASEPILNVDLGREAHATPRPGTGMRLKNETPSGPAPSPPIKVEGSSVTTQPHSPSPPAGATAAISRQRRLAPKWMDALVTELGPTAAKFRQRRLVLALAAGLLLLAGAGLGLYKMTAPSGPSKPAPQAAGLERSPVLRLLVPAYFYPTRMGEGIEQWKQILKSPLAKTTVVIVNVSSGPGDKMNPDYTEVIEMAKAEGVTAIGYVSTGYATKRTLQDVKDDVDRWVRFYPAIQGIFFDEQASSADQINYYASLYDFVKKQHKLSLVVSNPGTVCAEEYVSKPAADVVCMVEVTKDFGGYKPPAWANRYPVDRFAALIIKSERQDQMEKQILQMREKKIGCCFITNVPEPNPWGKLPRYWDAEVEAVRRADENR